VMGCDVRQALEAGQLQQLDARTTLAGFMNGDAPDRDRFFEQVGTIIRKSLSSRDDSVVAYGEMVDLLWRDGKWEAALRLEHLWNELALSCEFELLCAYSMNGFYKESQQTPFTEIEHRKQIELALLRELEERRKTEERIQKAEQRE